MSVVILLWIVGPVIIAANFGPPETDTKRSILAILGGLLMGHAVLWAANWQMTFFLKFYSLPETLERAYTIMLPAVMIVGMLIPLVIGHARRMEARTWVAWSITLSLLCGGSVIFTAHQFNKQAGETSAPLHADK